MLTNVEPMACGNCGSGGFRIFRQEQPYGFRLVVECEKCKSTSIIEPKPAELTIEFGEQSDGRLCRMEPND
ncbi:hypothetical protein [Caballeronia grimmiae]|uniref:hypothetical protein n=1 Tax=Caballeronia grimmiae TaxID=1071679 RepID=UPI001FD22E10|nr:hypothetical protein [Caballeronia grimmiae]